MPLTRTPQRLIDMDVAVAPDLHSQPPRDAHAISMVGHRGVRRPATLGGHSVWLTLDIAVGLSAEQRGGHMSRLITAVGSGPIAAGSLHECVSGMVDRLEDLVPGAPSFAVNAQAETILQLDEGGAKPVTDRMRLLRTPGEGEDAVVGLSCQVCLACPQAQAILQVSEDRGARHVATHNQVCVMEVDLHAPGWSPCPPDPREILDLCEQSASGPVREAHKRLSEAQVVADIHDNARFAEDALRSFATDAMVVWPSVLRVDGRLTNYESIFEYPLFAEIEVLR